MKKFLYAMILIITLTSAYSCSHDHYVSAQPEAVVVTRPAQPGPGYVWIDGDYYWRGNRYAYRNGYWARPRAGRTWNSGVWVQGPHGYYWRRGGWR